MTAARARRTRRPQDEHVVGAPSPEPGFFQLVCSHCKMMGSLGMPAGLETVLGFARGFRKDHCYCRPPDSWHAAHTVAAWENEGGAS